MAKLKSCPACENEVAKSAKTCPKCGKKLKMGFFKKALLGLAVLIAIGIALAPSPEERTQARSNEIEAIDTAQAATDIDPAELQQIFSFGSEYTDVQRDNKEEELEGKVLSWEAEVYEVNKATENEYRIQTSGNSATPAAFLKITTRSPEEVQYVEGLKTGDSIQFKGRVSGTTMRHIDFDQAVLVGGAGR